MEYNLIETAVIPEVPKVIPNEQLYVYIPVAAKDAAGIALFDENDFDIINGKVFLKNTYLTIDSIEAGGNITINKENGKIIISASIAGIVQETGTGKDVAMSQDATTKALTTLNNSLNANITGQVNSLNVQFNNKIAETNNNVTDINNKIPTQATENNKLADKAFVNSSVQTATANFRGNWSTWSAVPTNNIDYPAAYDGTTTPKTNDYLVVQNASDYSSEHYTLKGTWRFKYGGTWATEGKNGWRPEYQVNEEPLTSEQLAALDSGITSDLVTDITIIKNNYVTKEYLNNVIVDSTILNLTDAEMHAYLSGGLSGGQIALCSQVTEGSEYGYSLGELYEFIVNAATSSYEWVQLAHANIELTVPASSTNGTLTTAQLAILKANDTNGIIFDHEYYKLSTKGHVEGYRTYYTVERENGATTIKTITITESTLAWVLFALDVEQKPVDESYTIAAAMWRDLSGNSPYKYMASVTATYTIGDKTEVGIINDQPVVFANYGFVVGSISNQTVAIFAIDKPTAEINLSVRYRG